MIKVIGLHDGLIDTVGLTERGKMEVARIPQATLQRIVHVEQGEIGCVSVSALRRIGVDAGFYRWAEDGCDMWVPPMKGESVVAKYDARLKEMFTVEGVPIDMRALRSVLDVDDVLGRDDGVSIAVEAGCWMLVDERTERALVMIEDVALRMVYLTQGMKTCSFEVRDVRRVWDYVKCSDPFYQLWDINGNGDLRMWLGEDGVRLGDGEIAYSYDRDGSLSYAHATSPDTWMEKYNVWEEALKIILNNDKAVEMLLWKGDDPNESIAEVVKRGCRELGVETAWRNSDFVPSTCCDEEG